MADQTEGPVVEGDFEVEDAEGEEVPELRALVPRGAEDQAPSYVPAPIASAHQIIEGRKLLDQLISEHMRPTVDFAVIPGTSKPTLLKPGAEKAAAWFGYAIRFPEELRRRIEDVGTGFFMYAYTCHLVDKRSGTVVAECEGSANVREKRFHEYRSGKQRNPFDQVNPLQKMAQKRAMVGAILFGCALSEHFTQDVEDMDPDDLKGAGWDSEPFTLDDEITWGAHQGKTWRQMCDDPEGRDYVEWAIGRKDHDPDGLRKLGGEAKEALGKHLDQVTGAGRNGTGGDAPPPAEASDPLEAECPFRKHKGKTWHQVVADDPGYIGLVLSQDWGERAVPKGSALRRTLRIALDARKEDADPRTLFENLVRGAGRGAEHADCLFRVHPDLPEREAADDDDYRTAIGTLTKLGPDRIAYVLDRAVKRDREAAAGSGTPEKKALPLKLSREIDAVLETATGLGLDPEGWWETGFAQARQDGNDQAARELLDELRGEVFKAKAKGSGGGGKGGGGGEQADLGV